MNYRFPKASRLLHRRQFQRIARQHQSLAGEWILIEKRYRSNAAPSTPTRLGITVTRRYGKAHERNRFKRLIREAFRQCRHRLPLALEINIRPRQSINHLTPAHLIQELTKLLT